MGVAMAPKGNPLSEGDFAAEVESAKAMDDVARSSGMVAGPSFGADEGGALEGVEFLDAIALFEFFRWQEGKGVAFGGQKQLMPDAVMAQAEAEHGDG